MLNFIQSKDSRVSESVAGKLLKGYTKHQTFKILAKLTNRCLAKSRPRTYTSTLKDEEFNQLERWSG